MGLVTRTISHGKGVHREVESEGSHGANVGVDEQKPDMRPEPRGIQLEMENPNVTRIGDSASGNDQQKDEQLTRGDLRGWDHGTLPCW